MKGQEPVQPRAFMKLITVEEMEARNIHIKVSNVDLPVAFASAFEGEIIRRGDMQVEFDGSRVDGLELVRSKDMSEVEDHKITIIGPDLDELPAGSNTPSAWWPTWPARP